MLILGRDQLKDPSLGYARTFVRQLEDCLGLAARARRADRRATPAASTRRARRPGPRGRRAASGSTVARRPRRGRRPAPRAAELGLGARSPPTPTSAAFGIAAGLRGRRRRRRHRAASPTPRWSSGRPPPTSAGRRRRTTRWPAPSSPATCSSAAPRPPAATTVLRPDRGDAATAGLPDRRDRRRRLDASSPSTPAPAARSPSAPSPRSCSTRSQGPGYAGPDVATALDSVRLDAGRPPTGCAIAGVRGEAAPERSRSGPNPLGGFRNEVELVLTGLDIEAKADWVRAQLEAACGRPRSGRGDLDPRAGTDRPDADTRRRPASCCSVQSSRTPAEVAGRAFTAARSSSRWPSTPASR